MKKRIVLVTNKFIELAVEGSECEEQLEMFLRYHTHRLDESPYSFLFYAKDWFEARGFTTEVRPTDQVRGVKRLMIKLSLAKLRRRSAR